MLVPEFEALGKTKSEFFTVSHDDQDRLCLLVSFEKHVGNDFSRFLIEIACRFVAQEQLRLHDKRARQCDTLFLTT